MFRKLSALLLFAILTGCSTYGKVIIIKDDFKKSHIVTMKMRQISEEGIGDTWVRYETIFDFSREIGNAKVNSSVARFTVIAAADSYPLERSGFLRIGTKDSTLVLGNLDARAVTTYNTDVTTTTTTKNNSSGLSSSTSSFGKGPSTETKTSTSTSSRTHKELTGTFLLTKEQELELLASKYFAIRLYSGALPITIPFVEDDLEALKKFLRAKPGMEQE
ncbi:hypothetical protein CH352_01415 [Leptospira hartskeerlii]|uniref:Lipoprotein n=1 Tax=Leptospira hartskeerlii TaxID=2023177 RepID=A0A2M9XDU3_9LEPT|nr:hypothetical protein [Leptospira hartskeerlii]PJZ25868.1 hypothetical protein CH357_09560 [Leptospira hartskeerlii]PJZ35309.1 hypothetical protein CH352_01415 [Leptospira hartskeerlii]